MSFQMLSLGSIFSRRVFAVTLAGSLLSACGGSGDAESSGSGASNSDQPGTQVGYLKLGNAAGVAYSAGDWQGVTDSRGAFYYSTGQTVTFSVGQVELGSTLGKSVVTPVDLVPDGNEDNAAVVDVTRFLVALDDDGNTANGVVLSDAVQQRAQSWQQPDFGSAQFESQLGDILKDAEAVSDLSAELPTAATAKAFLKDRMLCAYAGAFMGRYTGSLNGRFGFVVDAQSGAVDGLAGSTLGIASLGAREPVSVSQDPVFVLGSVISGGEFDGEYTSPDSLGGSWEYQTYNGSFSGDRIGGDAAAVYRLTGLYSGEGAGLFAFDVDASGSITGYAYNLPEDHLYPLHGTVIDGVMRATTDNQVTIEGVFDASALHISGTWNRASNGSSGTYDGAGCRLN